jgi:hypothetical protein
MVDEPEMPPVSHGMTDRWFAVDSRQFVARAGGGRRVLRPGGRIISRLLGRVVSTAETIGVAL